MPQPPPPLPPAPLLAPIVQLTTTSTLYTPSYTIAPTTEIVTFTGQQSSSGYQVCQGESGYQVYPQQLRQQQHASTTSQNYLSPFGEPLLCSDQRSSAGYYQRYSLGHHQLHHQSAVSIASSNSIGCSSLFSVPGPSRSDSFAIMANRSRSRDKERLSHKRGTSVMSEPTEEVGRSCKIQRSHSSSLADYSDLQSNYTRDASRDDECQDDIRMMTPSPTASDEPRSSKGGGRQNHSEIEKRRRDKMNCYITELSKVVPMCITMSHKLDKLTVLRMAVQHLKTIRGTAIHSYTEGDYKPAFLSDEELKRLILQSADGFLFVVGCDRGRMLYVSESVSQVLNYSQGDLLGQSWFDILHPKDVAKVKEQLSSSDLSPRERLIDAKTMLPVKTDVPQGLGLSRLCPGARRSFFCRMKCRAAHSPKEQQSDTPGSSKHHRKSQNINKEKKYVVVHCTGYLKSWAPAKIGVDDQDTEGDVDACNLSCLVAVGRIQPMHCINDTIGESTIKSGPPRPPTLSMEFTSRHTIDGKFLFVDQRATLLLGLLPQELLGTSMYEYYHVEDIVGLTDVHKAALQTTESVTTPVYRFRIKEGTYVRLQSRWKSFRNPWTKDIEFLVGKNIYVDLENADVSSSTTEPTSNAMSTSENLFYTGVNNSINPTTRRLFNMELEASKIGQTVADEVLLDSHRSRSRSSTSALSSSAIRSPGSVVSPSTTASPISNINSPLDHEGAGIFALQEDIRRSATVSSSAPTALANTTRHEANQQNSASSLQVNSNSSGSDSSGSRSARSSNNHNNNHNHIKIRNNAQLLHMLNEAGLHADEDMMEVIGGLMMDQSQSSSRETNGAGDGNDEAAMAVVMSLLEADAGLGGPVDFSGLPWPLP